MGASSHQVTWLSTSNMALSASNIFEIRSTATAGNVNGGGFNPANANFLTDLACDTNTGNTASPIVSSASYNFVAGDVGSKVFIQAGTNWIPGWYTIASVATNKATLSAAIGAADIIANRVVSVSTALGCSTAATPTSGTFSVDYSQQDAAILALTDFASTASTTISTATGGVTPVMRGNILRLASGTGTPTAGWYEVVNTTNTNTLTADRVSGTYTAGVGKVGGALSLGSSDDAVFELTVNSTTATTIYFVKAATYTLGGTVSIAAAGNTNYWASIIGYSSRRNDSPLGASRPVFACGTAPFTIAAQWATYHMIFSGARTNSSSGTFICGSNQTFHYNCKFINSSTATNGAAMYSTSFYNKFVFCEFLGLRGYSAWGPNDIFQGCYFHHSNSGIATTAEIVDSCLFEELITQAVSPFDAVGQVITNNTFYGAENKLGTAITSAQSDAIIKNNIFYGYVTAINHGTNNSDIRLNNDFYNNTTDVAITGINSTELSLNPQFNNVTQLTGTTATTSGSVLTQTGANFASVVDNRDVCYIKSGTGITARMYLITGHTTDTLTLDIAPGTNATADKVWQVTLGHDFSIGTNLKAKGFPGAFPAGLTTSYLDIGAAQRQEAGGGGQSFVSG